MNVEKVTRPHERKRQFALLFMIFNLYMRVYSLTYFPSNFVNIPHLRIIYQPLNLL